MAKFCGKCGAKLDETTGLCPNCDADKRKMQSAPSEQTEALMRKQKKQTGITIGQKIRRFFLKLIATVVVVGILVAGIAGTLMYLGIVDISGISSILKRTGSEDENLKKVFENGDYVSTPDVEYVDYDTETNTLYFNNQLIVYTFTDLEKKDAERLAKLVGGKIVGDISGSINALQIRVASSTLNELEAIADELMELEDVLYAGYDYPIQLSPAATDTNSWSADRNKPEKNRGNEDTPDGNDWWAEAIGAYTAWNYSYQCQPIKVGILDSGFDTDHEDLEGSIFFLPDYTTNSEEDHGTHVAGIIGAHNNAIGIRGIVDSAKLICVDWSPTDSVNYLSTGEYSEIIKQMVDAGAKVINNSWIHYFSSEEGYAKNLYGYEDLRGLMTVKFTGAYDAYVEYCEVFSKRTALDCILMMTELMLNEEDEFLIVQCAGNGYDDAGDGVDTFYSGFFCAISPETYNIFSDSSRRALTQKGIDYDTIKDHVLIVGAVKNKHNEKGYRMTSFSNYGKNVDICAPGQDIYSTIPNNEYDKMPGTSMAAPMVSGSAAFIWSLNPELSVQEVRNILLTNTTTQAYGVGGGSSYKYPMLNIGAAAKAVITKTKDEHAQEPVRVTSDERDIVLVLDTSGSMSGTPMEETKRAATKFVDTILKEDASIGIVTYEDSAEQISDFSVDKSYLTKKVADIQAGGDTNIESGLAKARSMLNSSNAKKKIIVLMSDGEPNRGKQGEELIGYADEIKDEGILIYTLGFFKNMSGGKSQAQYLMEHLASDGCHYEVASADDLVFFFEDMADQINGQKYIYIRIACPVDVTVMHNGETLCSSEDDLSLRTGFGTLTFEENDNAADIDGDNLIKVLRLKEGADYDVQIVGTGRGIMNYTIGFMDDNGDYSDFRRFEDIKITRKTTIDTVAAVSKESILNIDEDGDGKYDLKLRAEENGYGEEVKKTVMFFVVIGGGTLLFLLTMIAIVQKNRKNKKAKENI